MGPLAGLKILDFTQFQNGPQATVMLSDMGADVLIKEVTPVNVNVKGLIYLEPGTNPTTTDTTIRAVITSR
ncbi:MAG TPA: hypothetical protein EYQ00_06315, partial [Dehalococcoidia bacterium]|nr:hypothetical protein [Dehalococcoidia bacterium]